MSGKVELVRKPGIVPQLLSASSGRPEGGVHTVLDPER
jgi:hypothetical protein